MHQKTRRVHQEPLYGTARPFRTPGGPLRYRMLHRQKGERPCLRQISQTARKEKAIAKSAARNARVIKIVFYLLSSKFFRTKSTKSSKFICPVSVESSKSYRNFVLRKATLPLMLQHSEPHGAPAMSAYRPSSLPRLRRIRIMMWH